jgi:hypothetical protein
MSQEFTMLVNSFRPRAAASLISHASVVFTVGGPLVYQPQSDQFGILSSSMNSDEAELGVASHSKTVDLPIPGTTKLAQPRPIHENED